MNVFEAGVARIRTEADSLLSTANLLDGLRQNSDCWTSPAFDLRLAARNLRETADKLENIVSKSQ